MFPHRRKLVAAAFVVLAAMSAGGFTQPDSLARRKMNVVRPALAGVPQQEQNALLDAATRAEALVDLDLTVHSGCTVVAVRTTGTPSYASFHVRGGQVFVLDLQDAVNFKAGAVLTFKDNPWVTRIRTSLFEFSPSFVSRVAIETTQAFQPQIRQQDGLIEITFGDAASEPPTAVATKADPLAAFFGELDKLCAQTEEPLPAVSSETPETDTQPPSALFEASDELETLTNDLASQFTFTLAAARQARPRATLYHTPRKTAYTTSSPMEVVVALPVDLTSPLAPVMATPITTEEPADLEQVDFTAPATSSQEEPAGALDSMQRLFDTLSNHELPHVESTPAPIEQPSLPLQQPTEQAAPLADPPELFEATPALELAAADPPAPEAPAQGPADIAAEEQAPAPTPDKPVEEAPPEPEPEPTKPVEQAPAEPEPEKPKKATKPTPEIRIEGELIALPAATPTLPTYHGDPLNQPVNIDFRDMELSNVVALLAHKAQINVVAGTEVVGTVTASLKNVPLRQALETLLRLNGLGIVEEAGIFRIVTYEEAVAARRETRMVFLENAKAATIKSTLDTLVTGMPESTQISVAADDDTNVVIIMGPERRVEELEEITNKLDITEQILPTVTEAIKLNYSDPTETKVFVDTMLTPEIGNSETDLNGRHLIVTDYPVVIEQVRALIQQVDMPVKQVNIEALIVDAVLRDASQTGVNWTVDVLRRYSTNGDLVSNLEELTFEGNMGTIGSDSLDAGIMTLGILSSEVHIEAAIAAEVQSRNAEILARPVIVAAENKQALIEIVQDFPYQEITQTTQGPPVASTAFKPIGVTLEVTPRVTHQDDILIDLTAKQSSISGLTEDGIPIEDKRQASTSLRTNNGRTIFLGGLRNVFDRMETSKIPFLGDIPIINFAFRDNDVEKINTELLIFLTCNVMGTDLPELNPAQEHEYDKLDAVPRVPNSQGEMIRGIRHPGEFRDPAWKWRRSE